jgi:phospholipase/carboxylesterase
VTQITGARTVGGLPLRRGNPPTTSSTLPHRQLDQQPTDPAIRAALAEFAFALPGVREQPSVVSVEGARALVLDGRGPVRRPEAFFAGTEFAHLHPPPDGSLHLTLPVADAQAAIEAGWAEPHYLVATGQLPPTVVLVYAPRDRAELDVAETLLRASCRFALSATAAGPASLTPSEGVDPR